MTFSAVTIKTATGAAAIAAVGLLTATAASAGNGAIQRFGTTEQLSGAGGAEITNYTVKDLRPSGNNDGVWFADVTATSAKGVVTPIIGDFNARAANGENYTSIEGANPGGLSNQPLRPGAASSGKIYFQVNNGTPPDSVVYNTGGNNDMLVWKG